MSPKFNPSWTFAAIATALFAGCNSQPGLITFVDAAEDIPNATTVPAPAASAGSQTVGPSCVNGDPDRVCLALHFVSYIDERGTPVVNQEKAVALIDAMNRVWSQCNIGFEIEKYETTDPAQHGLAYGAKSQDQLEEIRAAFIEPKNQLLAVTTGPWGTDTRAWTNLPGEGTYGAIMEATSTEYGDGVIYAHEFGHYLGLHHTSDESNLMDTIVYTDSKGLYASQCQSARDTAKTYWASAVRA